MKNMNMQLAKSITDLLEARKETRDWEDFIGMILHKLELPIDAFNRAKLKYEQLAKQVARKLDIADTDVHVVVQGSMRTQTVIRSRGNDKFDLDIVVKLSGPRFGNGTDSEKFFEAFGLAITDLNESSGKPIKKNRCWRLQYPGEPFYFDVTPAIPGSQSITGTYLRVRDPKTRWSPSNPEEFAEWFCELEKMRFNFSNYVYKAYAMDEARIDPLPSGPVGLDDIPRRFIQLIKLHRDSYYRGLSDTRWDARPISVILVTLAGHAYREMYARRQTYSSPIEVVLDLVELLPKYIDHTNGKYCVMNPAFPANIGENFADRWNTDGGQRKEEFYIWHERLVEDLKLLFQEEYSRRSETRIRAVFGQAGVDAWKGIQPGSGLINSILATPQAGNNPSAAIRTGSKNSLA